jgi:hypothetical protein
MCCLSSVSLLVSMFNCVVSVLLSAVSEEWCKSVAFWHYAFSYTFCFYSFIDILFTGTVVKSKCKVTKFNPFAPRQILPGYARNTRYIFGNLQCFF